MLIDTHCHIHDADYPLDTETVIANAHSQGVMEMICIGTGYDNSREAIEFANNHDGVFASAGVHPHDAKDGIGQLEEVIRYAIYRPFDEKAGFKPQKLIAVGEIGLDYHYDHSPHDTQIAVLKSQIEIALKHNLPIIFHVREAFDDFWPIFDNYTGVRGVLHSFSDTMTNAEAAIKRGLYIGVNGLSTFTKDEALKAMYVALPIDKILFETDAPYLTPSPFRGKVNEPAFVRSIAVFHSQLRSISIEEVENITTTNARKLFNL